MIYHITTKVVWLVAKTAGIYEPESLLQQGFINCCTEDKLEQILNFYFSGRTGLVALEIDPSRLHAAVKFEGVFRFPFRPVLH